MTDSYIVVGAGVFGASTALELGKAGHAVTVLERSLNGYHSPDAASNDLNKIVRADYSDEHYRELGEVAISVWKRSPLFSPFYHETGVLFYFGQEEKNASQYIREGVSRAAAHATASSSNPELAQEGAILLPLAYSVSSREDMLRAFPAGAMPDDGLWSTLWENRSLHAYFNPRGGWGEADRATRAVLDEAKRLGAKVYGESQVTQLLFDNAEKPTKVVGVRTSTGQDYHTSGRGHVILCAGAWANGLLQTLLPSSLLPCKAPTWPSAQCVVALQLDEEQRKKYKNVPVVLDFSTGFYCFEPDSEGVMKIAIHSNGYQNPMPTQSQSTSASFPTFASGEKGNTTAARGEEGREVHACQHPSTGCSELFIPKDKLSSMLASLAAIYPDLANATVKYTRVCFYSDSKDENWIIDHIPHLQGLVLAGGDSGHAFKFLPILGTLVCGRLGLPSVASLTFHQRHVFSFEHHLQVSPSPSPSDSTSDHTSTAEPAKVRFRL